MGDILERLKTAHRTAIEQRDLFACAIAEIEQARQSAEAEVERLRRQNRALANYRALLKNQGLNPRVFEAALERAEKAEAEVERLRARVNSLEDACTDALVALATLLEDALGYGQGGELLSARAYRIAASHVARVALGEDGE